MKILVTANQKGGVGKSTLTAHLAYAAHEDGKRVLMLVRSGDNQRYVALPRERS